MTYRRITKLIALALLLSCFPLAFSQSVATNTKSTITDLAWMSGGWRSAPGGRAQIEEFWTAPAGGSMMGMSRTIAGDKMVEFEFLRLEQRADGIYYVASPKGRCPATDFRLTNLSGQEATFENPQHDFPKRIIYRKNSDGSLVASIDGGAGTKSRSFAYLPVSK